MIRKGKSVLMGLVSESDADDEAAQKVGILGSLRRLSDTVAIIEAPLAGLLIAVVFGLLIANVVTRALTIPVYWIDELAIYAMIWSAFLGASFCLNRKSHIAVTLLADMVPRRFTRIFAVASNALLVAFFLIFAFVLWQWFDPLTLLASGSLSAFSQATFNFMYEEPTTTIGFRKVWFWLILPVFCLTGLLHTLTTLVEASSRHTGKGS